MPRRPALEFCALASGSKGNAVYVASEGRGVLIDVGLPAREVVRRLAAVGVDPASIAAVVVTHEHRDHISGVGGWARRFQVPVYAARETWEAATSVLPAGTLRGVNVNSFEPGESFRIDGLELAPIPTSHDARASVGFRIDSVGGTLGFVTDLGFVSHLVRESLRRVKFLYVESNHDDDLLTRGPYPWPLKQRIRSRHGHLSNGDCAALIADLVHGQLDTVVLGHLSETNNTPKLAFDAAHGALLSRGAESDITLLVARQDRPGRMVRGKG